MSSKQIDSEKLFDLENADLLKMRFKDLKLSLSDSEVSAYVGQLYLELEEKGLTFKPDFFIGDE